MLLQDLALDAVFGNGFEKVITLNDLGMLQTHSEHCFKASVGCDLVVHVVGESDGERGVLVDDRHLVLDPGEILQVDILLQSNLFFI